MGFIQKLPPQLVAAFRATLEDIQRASIILHVVDCSHPLAAAQTEAVSKVLVSLQAASTELAFAMPDASSRNLSCDLCIGSDDRFWMTLRRHRSPSLLCGTSWM